MSDTESELIQVRDEHGRLASRYDFEECEWRPVQLSRCSPFDVIRVHEPNGDLIYLDGACQFVVKEAVYTPFATPSILLTLDVYAPSVEAGRTDRAVRYTYFKESGKYYSSEVGRPPQDAHLGVTRMKILVANDGKMPGLSTLGEDFRILIQGENFTPVLLEPVPEDRRISRIGRAQP